MDWEIIDISSEHEKNEQFVDIVNGKIKISIGACNQIKDFDKCNYVSFLRAKRDRIYFLGLKFEQTCNDKTLKINKKQSGLYGATISAPELVYALYGKEGKSKNYTRHHIDIDPSDTSILVVYYNYNKEYSIKDNNSQKRIKTRHIGSVVNDEWLVVSSTSKGSYPKYLLRNINTKEEIYISSRALADIERGITSVSNIKMCREVGTGKWLGKIRAEKKKKLKVMDNKELYGNNR